MKSYQKYNIASLIFMVINGIIIWLLAADHPITWRLFPNDTALFMPLLFFIPMLCSTISMRIERNIWAILTMVIAVMIFIITGIMAMYIFALGSAWQP